MIRYKPLYIAKRLNVTMNDYGMEVEEFAKPKPYNFLYMPTSGMLDYQIYGEKISGMYTAYVDYDKYLGCFLEGDRAYMIDSDLQDLRVAETDINCENANYVIKSVQLQNLKIKLTFEKIKQTR